VEIKIANSMKYYTIASGLLLLLMVTLDSYAQNSFQEFQRQQQQQFDSFTSSQEAAYDVYLAQQDSLFQAFKAEMEKKWGSFQERTQIIWTQYNEFGNGRWQVDFESGRATVEVLVDTKVAEEEVIDLLSEQVIQLLNDQGTQTGMPGDTSTVQDEPILAGQVDTNGELLVVYAERIVRDNIEKEVVQTDALDATTMIYRINLDLLPNHISTRATRFAAIIEKYCERYNLSPSLVLAIMHTESFFNPVALSHANAHGLMQLVPISGGRDAYRFVYGRDGVPERDYLFNPDNNIKLGTAYLHILINNYLRGVRDAEVLTLLAISSYNTGVGNTAMAYTGNRNFREATSIINGMPSIHHYEFLRANLPYQETRDYIQKVTERMSMYEKWLQNNGQD
jgi:membrane-bound lytic murein transglycosylase C